MIAGTLLVGVWLVAWVHSSVLSRRDVARFEEVRSERVRVRQIEPTDAVRQEPVETSLWSPERVEGYQESLVHDFDLPLAVLRVPAVDIEVPVLPGTDELTLNRGVGWIGGTASPGAAGNFAVAGHRDGFFRGLKDIELGDEIEVETLDAIFTYVIDNLTVVDPSDVWVLEPRDQSSVTLVTCYPFYFVGSAPNRFIVQASLREEQSSGKNANGVDGNEADSGV
jgi:sortase A